ncbi:MAG TPA: aldehyde dehydrogenase family protein [Phycisphaerae bacterium]|nr:aldehyde dehydrogenase family protein [Phycisphaerae bacterium]
MFNGIFKVPQPANEPVRSYAPGTPERASLKAKLRDLLGQQVDVPMIIGGKVVRNGALAKMVCPHDHHHVLGEYHQAGQEQVHRAIAAANAAKKEWSQMPWDARAVILLKAADLLAGKYRATLNATTMLNMSKTAHQAEIDAACELIDFWRFNPHFMEEVYGDQPISPPGVMNYMEHRPLEGFVLALTPFNFTSIAGKLPTAPALMGNTVVWKPASAAVLPAYFIMKILEEAGMPPGVINMIAGPGPVVAPPALNHLGLGGIHFTGSTYVFSTIWLAVGSDIRKYCSYPRIVGETGGKDFIVAHASADVDALATALVRGAFEYQGQKCSAASRAYINDKPTGAVVGQQPFGGARASGTNDKAGSWLNLERWVSPRTIKETFLPPTDFRYPYMAEA